jgi:hypothetical protein
MKSERKARMAKKEAKITTSKNNETVFEERTELRILHKPFVKV